MGWGDGLSGLLAFITQMALVLMLGHILANTGPVRRLLARLASIPRTPLAAYIFVFVVAAAASLITWGLGLVVGALLAKEVAAQARERGLVLHFPMLVAAGFSGFVVWHMGYSGSGPLTAATPGSFLTESLDGRTVPVSETTFSWWNITAAVVTVLVVALALFLVAPRAGDRIVELEIDARDQDAVSAPEIETPADRLDASRVPTLLVGAMLVVYLVMHFVGGGTLTLDIVNWSFLALILLLVRSPHELIGLTQSAASNVGEILLQFPLYAGILGMMTSTGLVAVLSDAFVAISNPVTFGLLAFLAAGLGELLRPLRRRTVRRAGPDHAPGRRRARRGPGHHHHGRLLRRPVDQHDPAVLGDPPSGDRRAEDARHPGVHHGRAARVGARLRRHAPARLALTRSADAGRGRTDEGPRDHRGPSPVITRTFITRTSMKWFHRTNRAWAQPSRSLAVAWQWPPQPRAPPDSAR